MSAKKAHRLVVLGNSKSGKTAVIEQLVFGNHVVGQESSSTLGDVYEVCAEAGSGNTEKLQIFDTPGDLFTAKGPQEQEHFLSIAEGFVLVYEVTNKDSYDNVTLLRQKISQRNRDVPVVVLGNKSDLSSSRAVDFTQVLAWARQNAVNAYEVTVIDRETLKEPFCYIARRMFNPGRAYQSVPSSASIMSLRSRQAERHDGACATDGETGKTQNRPEDAVFPKQYPVLFFADCMSSRSRRGFT
ncbi:hypothetical protein EMCRGX_G025436 [Ephydatia muelleri]|eukprot:Em0021g264a